MTRISFTDSWFGVTTAAPPHAWLIAVTPSSWKLFASTRWPFALTGTWFSVPKIELFEPPGPCLVGHADGVAGAVARAEAEDPRREAHELVGVASHLRQGLDLDARERARDLRVLGAQRRPRGGDRDGLLDVAGFEREVQATGFLRCHLDVFRDGLLEAGERCSDLVLARRQRRDAIESGLASDRLAGDAGFLLVTTTVRRARPRPMRRLPCPGLRPELRVRGRCRGEETGHSRKGGERPAATGRRTAVRMLQDVRSAGRRARVAIGVSCRAAVIGTSRTACAGAAHRRCLARVHAVSLH